MSKMKYLVTHCSDTPYDREVTPDDIWLWHLGACLNKDGKTYTFLKETSLTVEQLRSRRLTLPSGKVVAANLTNGRGWSKPGYADLIQRSGKVVNLVPYNADDVIDSSEITNGASGYNSESRHVCLVGGWSKDGKIKSGIMKPTDIYTPAQLIALTSYYQRQRGYVPTVTITGHNKLSQKTCPNFDVETYLKTFKL